MDRPNWRGFAGGRLARALGLALYFLRLLENDHVTPPRIGTTAILPLPRSTPPVPPHRIGNGHKEERQRRPSLSIELQHATFRERHNLRTAHNQVIQHPDVHDR